MAKQTATRLQRITCCILVLQAAHGLQIHTGFISGRDHRGGPFSGQQEAAVTPARSTGGNLRSIQALSKLYSSRIPSEQTNSHSTKREDSRPRTRVWQALLFACILAICPPSALSSDPTSLASSHVDPLPSVVAPPPIPAVSPPPERNSRHSSSSRYWHIQEFGAWADRRAANTALLDFELGTIHTMYYDPSGGAYFEPRTFALQQRHWLRSREAQHVLSSRQGVVAALKRAVTELGDPFSHYLTREELQNELSRDTGSGFLGLGALIEPPTPPTSTSRLIFGYTTTANPVLISNNPQSGPLLNQDSTTGGTATTTISVSGSSSYHLSKTRDYVSNSNSNSNRNNNNNNHYYLSVAEAVNLPVVTAVVPDSWAEREGVTVGDRLVGVAHSDLYQRYWARDSFVGRSPSVVAQRLNHYTSHRSQFWHRPDEVEWELRLAKPVVAVAGDRNVVVGYRSTRVRVPDVTATTRVSDEESASDVSKAPLRGGNALVHYELLTDSIFHHTSTATTPGVKANTPWVSPLSTDASTAAAVGYIRLTRFSRASTAEFVKAVETLEQAGAQSLIVDLRNNYGGIIQEAMLQASSLLRDPHAVLCYTLNSRGGFTPHDVEEYVVDTRYPGYLMGRESRDATLRQVQRETPELIDEDGIMWVPPSSYASLHEQTTQRGIHRPALVHAGAGAAAAPTATIDFRGVALPHPKKLVLLVNEGTASSAEVFAAALRDNGRAVALVGTKTYGKGLIQHTFPMPDGGGLRLTVAEYLTPSLHHVTHVGAAQWDPRTGERIGGGIQPDVYCESTQGIPSHAGADLCVGVALDVLEEAESLQQIQQQQQQRLPPLSVSALRWTNGGFSGSSSHNVARRSNFPGVVKVRLDGFR